MAAKIIWLRAAANELEAICRFIEADSPRYASVVAARVVAAAEELATFPRMGSIVRELNREDIRQRIVYSYRSIYRIRGEAIEILGVIHGARQLPRDLANRGGG